MKLRGDSQYGTALRELRTQTEMTAEELGKFLRVDKATVSRYEHGQLKPDLPRLAGLARLATAKGRADLARIFLEPFGVVLGTTVQDLELIAFEMEDAA